MIEELIPASSVNQQLILIEVQVCCKNKKKRKASLVDGKNKIASQRSILIKVMVKQNKDTLPAQGDHAPFFSQS